MAEKYFKLPIFYVEYSGTYGDVEIVKEVSNVLERNKIILWWRNYVNRNKQWKWLNMQIQLLWEI